MHGAESMHWILRNGAQDPSGSRQGTGLACREWQPELLKPANDLGNLVLIMLVRVQGPETKINFFLIKEREGHCNTLFHTRA